LGHFAETSNGPVARSLWDQGLVDYNNQGQIVVNKEATKEAAAALVAETRDASLPRDYIVASYRDLRGVEGSDRRVENRINAEMSDKARAIQIAAQVGGVRFTEAQSRYLQDVSAGKYLALKYSQFASGNRGTLQGVARERGGSARSEFAEYMRQERRREFVEVRNPGAFAYAR
jgi:hypothetical protein